MSTLYKRKKSPYWVYSSYVRGKRVRMSTGMRARHLAAQLQTKWDMMVLNGDLSFVKSANIITGKLQAFMDEYLKLRSRVSDNTYHTARAVLGRFTRFLKEVRIVKISEITIKVLDDYIDYLKLAPKTKHNHIKEIKIMLDRAVAEKFLDTNPAKHVTLPKIIKKDLHRMLEPIDLKIIFEGANSYKLFYEFLYYTGLRAGDVAMLTFKDLDFKRSSIKSLIRKADRFHELPLADELLCKIVKGNKLDPLFPTLYANTKKKVNNNLARPRLFMQALLKSNGRPIATLHSFRTTFNNTLRDLGLDMDDRRQLMTHSSSETTKIYTHPNFDLAKEWIDRMPRFS